MTSASSQGWSIRFSAMPPAGSLPLLEFTLTKLWGTQRHRTLTFAGYHQMGGVRGALDRFAEEKAVELTETAAEVLDQVLLRLVRTTGRRLRPGYPPACPPVRGFHRRMGCPAAPGRCAAGHSRHGCGRW